MSLVTIPKVREEHEENGSIRCGDINSGKSMDVVVSDSATYDDVRAVSVHHTVTNTNTMTSPAFTVICSDTMTSWEQITSLCEILGPIMCSSVLSFGIQTITNSYVGRRLGPTSFAYFSLGVSVFNMFGLSIGMGLVAALDTLVSQAYGRVKQQGPDIGIFCQRAVLVSALVMIPIALLLTMGGPVFTLMFGKELGDGALLFTRHSVPYFFFSTLVQVFVKTITAINEPVVPLICYSTSIVICIVLNHAFTYSIESAVYCLTATYAVMLVMLVLFTRFHPRITFWKECSWPDIYELKNMSGMTNFLKVGIPSLISTCAEWWAFEVLYVVAASISIDVVEQCTLFSTVAITMFSIASLGVSVAASVRVGNSLGANKPYLARQFAIMSLYMSTFVAVINGLTVCIFRHQIAALFTSDEALSSAFIYLAPLLFCHHLSDATQFTFQGVYRGANMPDQAARIVVGTLWTIGIPCSIIFGKWFGLGTKGIYLGLLCGFLVEIPLLWRGMLNWNWTVLSMKAVTYSLDAENADDFDVFGNNDDVMMREHVMSINETDVAYNQHKRDENGCYDLQSCAISGVQDNTIKTDSLIDDVIIRKRC